MSNSHMIVSLPSSRGWKKAERIIEDVAPTKFVAEASAKGQDLCPNLSVEESLNSKAQGDEKEQLICGASICLVCSENQARYTCPQCQTPYCSIECFRNHADASSSGSSNEGSTLNNKQTSSCSEHFFKRKVTSLMQLESLENEEKTRRALNRYHHDNFGRQDCEEPQEAYENEIESLYELQSQLEILESGNKELSQRELTKMLPPSLKAMFEKDLQTGQLQAEWVLNHWHPWWKRELVVNGKKIEEENDVKDHNQNHEDRDAASKTLDERLLRVPKYESFGGRKSNDKVLLFNLIDILVSFVSTIRLYHGVENASRQAPVEAATTLISTSSVLGKDTRFDSIYQVLDHHYNGTTEKFASSANGSNSDKLGDWHVYIEDVASIVSSPRMVGRALLEASDILKAAIKKLKLDDDESISKRDKSTDDCQANLNQMRRLRKKLQFFLSWATRHPDAKNLLAGGGPKDEILTWIDERKQIFTEYARAEDDNSSSLAVDGCLERGIESAMGTLNLHHSGFIDSNSSDSKIGLESQEPLFVEVQSRRKNVE